MPMQLTISHRNAKNKNLSFNSIIQQVHLLCFRTRYRLEIIKPARIPKIKQNPFIKGVKVR